METTAVDLFNQPPPPSAIPVAAAPSDASTIQPPTFLPPPAIGSIEGYGAAVLQACSWLHADWPQTTYPSSDLRLAVEQGGVGEGVAVALVGADDA